MENRFIPCNKCDICNSCGGLRGTGPQPADLMLISDFPHDNDLAYGNYFTGAVGTEWDKIAKLTDIDKSKVYITSVVKCRPPVVLKKEGSIKQNHINNCALYIEEELCLTEPKIVVLLGQHAFRRFFPKDNFTDCRGTFIWSDKYNCYFVPTYNFTAMLGSAKFDPIIKKDFGAVSNYLKTGTVPKFNPPDYRFILKEDQFPLLEAFVIRMAQVPSFSFDIETSSTNYMQAKMLSIAFSWKKDTGWTIPLWVKDEAAVKAKIDSLNKKMAELEVAQFIEIGTVTPEKVEELVKQRELENVKNNVEISTSEIRKNVKKECLDKIKAKYKEQIRAVKQELRAYEAEVDHNPPLKQYWGDKHDYVFSKIKEILENNTPKGGHNAWFDIQMLHFMGIVVNNYEFDTLIEHHLTDEERQHGLDALSWLFTDRGGYKSKKDVYLNSESTCWANIPLDVLLPYNAMDADVTQQIHEVLVKKLDEENITWLYKNVVMPAQRALLDATYYGALVDVEFVKKQQKYFAEQIKECVLAIQNEISVAKPGYLVVESKEEQDRITQEYKDNGLPMPMFYNLASTRQMISLFKDLGFKFYKQTRTGDSLDEEVLKKFSKVKGKGKIAEILLKYREYSKLKSTYLDATLENLDKNNRIHTTYKLGHAVTGRTSSENPNLQNIPRDGSVKGMFIPSPGKVMVNIDMSQHELRVLSGLSNDKVMQGIYNEGRDLHLETAASIFGIPPEQVTKEQRVQAKRVNFGIPYGVSGAGLVDLLASDGIRITKTQGEKYIEGWKKKFPHAAYYLEHSKKMFSQQGYLVTPWGRRRRKYKQYYANSGKESASDRQAMNYPIQSFASDIVLSLIGKLYPILKSMGIPLLLTVHDSIVVECREDQLAELARLVKQYTWLRPKELNGALVCTEMEIGYRWSEVVPMNFDEPEYARWRIVKAGKIVYYWGSEASAKKYAEGKFKEGYELYRETGA